MARKNDTLSGEFFRFLQKLNVLDAYLYYLKRSFPDRSYYHFLFGVSPSSWLLCAFDWEMCAWINWRFIHNLWLTRLDTLKKKQRTH